MVTYAMARPSTERIGSAIALVLAESGMSQSELARRLRARGHLVDQSRISEWVRGVRTPHELMLYAAIEDECSSRLGTIFRRAGFVDDVDLSVEQAIKADPDLSADDRRTLLGFYEFARNRAAISAR